MSTSKSREKADWIKVDLHIHTLDDPKDAIDYSAHQLLERAKELGFGVLAITLHDAVFDRPEVFADAAAMGILLIPAAEMRWKARTLSFSMFTPKILPVSPPLPICGGCEPGGAIPFLRSRRIRFIFWAARSVRG